MTSGLDDDTIQEMMHEFGSDGYLAWFGLLEMAGAQVNSETNEQTWFEFLPTRMKQKMHISTARLRRILSRLQEKFNKTPTKVGEKWEKSGRKVKLLCDFSGENWRFQIPKLMEIKDEYAQKSGQYRDIVPHKNKELKNTDIKSKEEEKNNGTGRARASKADPRSNTPQIQAFRETTNSYPRKVLYDEVIRVVGPATANDLKPYFLAWMKSGNNATGTGWLFDWFANKTIPAHKSKVPVSHISNFDSGEF